mmetsp:Transcript_72922/g.173711  ORF Transcript_72922/g.173711 Transcript_72922/m.173711 type:complete len:644 (-) Transcript_72922:11-1942(-)
MTQGKKHKQKAASQKGGAGQDADAIFATKCDLFRAYYSAVGKSEWWWIMDDSLDVIAKQLQSQAFCVLDSFLPEDQARALTGEVKKAHSVGDLQPAGLVNGKLSDMASAKYADTATRGDVVGWFEGNQAEWPHGRQLENYLLKLGTVVSELGKLIPELATITSRSKAMAACYPGEGARYVAHVDNDGKHPHCRTRVLTALMYLNPEWQPGDGGELAVLSQLDKGVQRKVVEPLAGRLLLFWSDWRVPHEVLAAWKPRYAVTVWLLNRNLAGEDVSEAPPPAVLSSGESGDAADGDAVPAVKRAAAEAQGATAEGSGESVATQGPSPEETTSATSISYEWSSQEDLWELRVQVGQSSAGCPLLDLSDEQIRISSSSGDVLLCLPSPLRCATLAQPPRWSQRKAQLVVKLAVGSVPESVPCPHAGFVSQLCSHGWAYQDGFLRGQEADDVRSFVLAAKAGGRLKLGTNAHEGPAGEATKNDKYCFLSSSDGGLAACTHRVNQLMVKLLREVPLLSGVDMVQGQPMAAVYPGGGSRYGKHVDSTMEGRGNNGRVMTLLVYLNPYWKPADGGCLRLYKTMEDTEGVIDIEPLHGRLVAFFCQNRCPHEVLPSYADRAAVTYWYYDGSRLQERCAPGAEVLGYAFEGG